MRNTHLSRRALLTRTTTLTLGLLAASAATRVFAESVAGLEPFKGEDVFQRILKKAQDGKWADLPIGQCMGKIAMEFVGTPYVGFTLELSPDQEVCAVNPKGLDCVPFFEDTLDFARMLKTGG